MGAWELKKVGERCMNSGLKKSSANTSDAPQRTVYTRAMPGTGSRRRLSVSEQDVVLRQ